MTKFTKKTTKQPICAGDRVTRDAATQNEGKVKLGDSAPIFQPSK